MIYDSVTEGRFVSRLNRFVAIVEIDGTEQVCHVKNTGRCAELFVPGTTVWVQHSDNRARKTAYDLITVDRGGVLVNVDSQAPNKLFAEWAEGIPSISSIRAEVKYGESRFDFRLERGGRPMFVEVKGVTLERDGRALFPDAPTERGVKHINELIRAKGEGYDAGIFFVVQMKLPRAFSPNRETHPEFADALMRAKKAGVEIFARDCVITPNSARIDGEVPIEL